MEDDIDPDFYVPMPPKSSTKCVLIDESTYLRIIEENRQMRRMLEELGDSVDAIKRVLAYLEGERAEVDVC